jgi:predicted metal-dependent enzyme (double-stranded beta helix superfamily)
MDDVYRLPDFVADLRAAAASARTPAETLARVRPLAVRLAADRAWLSPEHYRTDSDQGFLIHLLHEEPNHDLAVMALAWLPGRGTPPHDHGTWAIVVGVDGEELNEYWRRVDDRQRPGYAELEKVSEKVCGKGEVVQMLPGAIHSVTNVGSNVALSLHVYGRHINYTGRSRFDVAAKTITPWLVTKQA